MPAAVLGEVDLGAAVVAARVEAGAETENAAVFETPAVDGTRETAFVIEFAVNDGKAAAVTASVELQTVEFSDEEYSGAVVNSSEPYAEVLSAINCVLLG